jgi:hypothetical protein
MRRTLKNISLAEREHESENEQFEDYKIAHIAICECGEKLQ